MKYIGIAFVMIMVASAAGIFANSAHAAGGPTVYASFDSPQARGVVEVQQFMSGTGSQVTARIKRPDSGLVGFCLFLENGSESCQTVSPTDSSFSSGSAKGCATFTISFSENVTYAAITDVTFVNVIALAPLVGDPPKNLGSLNPCPR